MKRTLGNCWVHNMKLRITILLLFILTGSWGIAQTTFKSIDKALLAQATGIEVEHLDLSKKKLDSIPVEVRGLTGLKTLTLDKNKITEIPFWVRELENLELLSVERNLLEEFPTVVLELSKLKILKLGDNLINEIPLDIDKLENLERLVMWSNVVRLFPASLSDMKSLSYLDLLYNDMTQEEQRMLKNLLPKVYIELSDPCTCDFED